MRIQLISLLFASSCLVVTIYLETTVKRKGVPVEKNSAGQHVLETGSYSPPVLVLGRSYCPLG